MAASTTIGDTLPKRVEPWTGHTATSASNSRSAGRAPRHRRTNKLDTTGMDDENAPVTDPEEVE